MDIYTTSFCLSPSLPSALDRPHSFRSSSLSDLALRPVRRSTSSSAHTHDSLASPLSSRASTELTSLSSLSSVPSDAATLVPPSSFPPDKLLHHPLPFPNLSGLPAFSSSSPADAVQRLCLDVMDNHRCFVTFSQLPPNPLSNPLSAPLPPVFNFHLSGSYQHVMSARGHLLREHPFTHRECIVKLPSPDDVLDSSNNLSLQVRRKLDAIASASLAHLSILGLPSAAHSAGGLETERNIHVLITGSSEAIHLARVCLLVLFDNLSNLATETCDIAIHLHNIIAGPKRSSLQSIMEETATNIYFPNYAIGSPAHSASKSSTNTNANRIYVTGEYFGIQRARDMLLQMATHKTKSILTKDVAILSRKLDWMLVERTDEIKQIMHDNGTFIQFPTIGSQASAVTVYGDNSVAVERTIKLIMQLACQFYVASFWLLPLSFDVLSPPPAINPSQVSIILQRVAVVSGVEAVFKTNCFELHGIESDVRTAIELILELDMVKVFRHEIRFQIELANEHRDFISGKKNGKINKIMKTTSVKIKFETFNDYNFQIDVFGTDTGALQGLALLQEELPAETSFHVPEAYHKRIIGVGGKNIQRIMKKFGVYVKFSSLEETASFGGYQDPQDNVVAKTPTKNAVNLENLKAAIMELMNPKDKDFVVETVAIPRPYHRTLLGEKHIFIHDIEQKTNSVFHFPSKESASDIVTIYGPESQIHIAAQMLLEHVPLEAEYRLPYNQQMSSLVNSTKFVELVEQVKRAMSISIVPYISGNANIDTVIKFSLSRSNVDYLTTARDMVEEFFLNNEIPLPNLPQSQRPRSDSFADAFPFFNSKLFSNMNTPPSTSTDESGHHNGHAKMDSNASNATRQSQQSQQSSQAQQQPQQHRRGVSSLGGNDMRALFDPSSSFESSHQTNLNGISSSSSSSDNQPPTITTSCSPPSSSSSASKTIVSSISTHNQSAVPFLQQQQQQPNQLHPHHLHQQHQQQHHLPTQLNHHHLNHASSTAPSSTSTNSTINSSSTATAPSSAAAYNIPQHLYQPPLPPPSMHHALSSPFNPQTNLSFPTLHTALLGSDVGTTGGIGTGVGVIGGGMNASGTSPGSNNGGAGGILPSPMSSSSPASHLAGATGGASTNPVGTPGSHLQMPMPPPPRFPVVTPQGSSPGHEYAFYHQPNTFAASPHLNMNMGMNINMMHPHHPLTPPHMHSPHHPPHHHHFVPPSTSTYIPPKPSPLATGATSADILWSSTPQQPAVATFGGANDSSGGSSSNNDLLNSGASSTQDIVVSSASHTPHTATASLFDHSNTSNDNTHQKFQQQQHYHHGGHGHSLSLSYHPQHHSQFPTASSRTSLPISSSGASSSTPNLLNDDEVGGDTSANSINSNSGSRLLSSSSSSSISSLAQQQQQATPPKRGSDPLIEAKLRELARKARYQSNGQGRTQSLDMAFDFSSVSTTNTTNSHNPHASTSSSSSSSSYSALPPATPSPSSLLGGSSSGAGTGPSGGSGHSHSLSFGNTTSFSSVVAGGPNSTGGPIGNGIRSSQERRRDESQSISSLLDVLSL